jgi:ATP-binding cassette subfamily B protein
MLYIVILPNGLQVFPTGFICLTFAAIGAFILISNKNKLLKNVFILLRPYKKNIFMLIFCVLITSGTAMLNPLINKNLIDNGVMAHNLEVVIKYTLIILGLFVVEQIIEFIEFREYSYINNMLSAGLFLKAFKHAMKLKMSYHYDTNISKIMSEVTQDVTNIATISERDVLVSVTQILRVVGGIIGLVLINWKLTLFVLAVIPLKLVLTALFARKRQQTIQDMMDANSKFSFWYGETLGGVSEIKLWNLYTKKISEFIGYQKRLIRLKIRYTFLDQVNQVSTMTLETLIINCLYILGAVMIIKADFTLGGMFSFVMYSSYVLQPVSLLMNLFYQFSNINPAMERYTKFLSVEGEALPGKNAIKLSNQNNFPEVIRFEHVTLRYRDENVINDLSLEIRRGQKIAIIGANGSGKSSLINLLLRFYTPVSGRIYMDDIDIAEIHLNDYRDLFSVMSQNVYLFNTTIEDNIKMYKNISEQQLINSCIESDAIGFIEKLQEKFKTAVGFRGSKLSGGERQKVALARTLAKKAPILILDETTSNYDYESEQFFNMVVKENINYQFILVISHRPDILKAVDKILVLDKGCIAGFGSYEQLYGSNALFTSMNLIGRR